MQDILLWSKEYGWGAVILVTLFLNAGKIWKKLACFFSSMHKQKLNAQEQERDESIGALKDVVMLYRSHAAEEKLERQQTQEKLLTLVTNSIEMNVKVATAMEKINASIQEINQDRTITVELLQGNIQLMQDIQNSLNVRRSGDARLGD